MATVFHLGDRVRLGILRGGIVVKVNGDLRVLFPHSQRLLYLDYMVPDEGPDGKIYPNTWDTCERCGNPTVSEVCCNCTRRGFEEAAAFDRAETRREHNEAIERGEPAFGIHVASSIRRHGRTIEQRCARCSVVLGRVLGDGALPWAYPEGALVERHYLGLGPAAKGVTEATCTPVRELAEVGR